MQDVDTEWLSRIIIGMGPMWVVKTGDDRREAGAGRTVTASLGGRKGPRGMWAAAWSYNRQETDSPMGTQPCPPT